MDHLPWIVVHGAIVWKVALGVTVTAGVAISLSLRSVRVRLRGRRIVESLPPPLTSADNLTGGTEVCIEGRLNAGDLCLDFAEPGEVAACTAEFAPLSARYGFAAQPRALVSQRASTLTLDLAGVPIELDGGAVVDVGSGEWWPASALRTLPRHTRTRLRNHKETGAVYNSASRRPRFRSVTNGDRVRIMGTLTTRAGAEHRDYRNAAAQWRMSGNRENPLRIVFVGKAHGRPRPKRQFVLLAAAVAAGFLALSAVVGSCAIGAADDRETRKESNVWSEDWLDAWSIAAATPFHRDEALEKIEDSLRHAPRRTRSRTNSLTTIMRMRGRCMAAAYLVAERGRPKHAIDEAMRCDESYQRESFIASMWMRLGNYDRASEIFERLSRVYVVEDESDHHDTHVQVAHLLAGRYELAAESMRVHAQTLPGDSAVVIECASYATDLLAGNGQPDWPDRGTSIACDILRADTLEGQERRAALLDISIPDRKRDIAENDSGGYRAERRHSGLRPVHAALWAELGEDRVPRIIDSLDKHVYQLRPQDLMTQYLNTDTFTHGVVAIERAALGALVTTTPTSDSLRHTIRELSMQAAEQDLIRGRYDESLAWIERALAQGLPPDSADAKESDAYWRSTTQLSGALFALLADDMATARHYRSGVGNGTYGLSELNALMELRDVGEVAPYVEHKILNELDDAERAALEAAARGDGRAVAELEDVLLHRRLPSYLLFVGPRLELGREALIEALEWGTRPFGIRRGEPAAELEHVTWRLQMARALGAHALLEDLQAVADRHWEALTRRDTALILYILTEL